MNLESVANDDAGRRSGRWRWWVATVLVAAAWAPFVVGLMRSSELNEAEESLVGAWRMSGLENSHITTIEFTLQGDHTAKVRMFDIDGPIDFDGFWRANERALRLHVETLTKRSWQERLQVLFSSGKLVGAENPWEFNYEGSSDTLLIPFGKGLFATAVRVTEIDSNQSTPAVP